MYVCLCMCVCVYVILCKSVHMRYMLCMLRVYTCMYVMLCMLCMYVVCYVSCVRDVRVWYM